MPFIHLDKNLAAGFSISKVGWCRDCSVPGCICRIGSTDTGLSYLSLCRLVLAY